MLKKVKIFDKYNYIEDDKKLLSNAWFDKVGEFKSDLAYVYKEGVGYNFLNKNGKLLSETFFKNINEFNNRFITNVILPNGELGSVDSKGVLFDKNKNKITEKITFNEKTEVENFVNGVFETAINFEDSIVLEKRSHPETNIDLHFTEYLNKLLGKYKIEDVFVSFRRTEQVSDINPNNEYYTPSGFYSYPLKKYLTSSNINYDNFIKLFPFTGGDFKYIYFFVLNKKENVLDNKTTDDEIKHFVNSIKTIYGSFDGIETICNQFFNDKYYLHGVENKLERFWYFLNDVYKYTYAGKNKQNSIYKICYNIGLDGVIDNGLGFIHKNEPIQAVFFKVKNIGELFYFKKKDIEKDSILTAVENGDGFENLRLKYKFLSLKSAREFTNKYPNEKIFFKGIYDEIYFSKDFDYVSNFEDGISIVELKNKFNIIDLNGKLLFNNWFDDVIKQYNNLFKIEDNNEFNFITSNNKLLNNEWFNYASNFFQGYSRVNKNNKWNLLDTGGELISNDWFDEISEMRYGRVKFKINDIEGIIDYNGNIITNKILNNEGMNKKIKITKKQLNEMLSVLSEATATEIREKYYSKIPEDVFKQIVSSDELTSNLSNDKLGEYGKWLLNIYIKGNLKLEDLYKTKEYFPVFDKAKKSKKLQNQDLNSYKSLADMYIGIEQFIGQDAISNKEVIDKTKKEEAEVVYEDNEWKVIVPKTEAAACLYGANTQWCTAAKNNNRFDYYNEKGNLYININKKTGRKYQFHFQARQFMDENDLQVEFNDLKLNKQLTDFYTKIDPFLAHVDELIETYSFVSRPSEGVVKVGECVDEYCENMKIGYVDQNLKIIIPLIYDFGEDFSDGLCVVGFNERYGVVCGCLDKNGAEVIKIKYEYIRGFKNGVSEATINGRRGFIDKQGNWYDEKPITTESKKIKITKEQLNEVKERLVEEQIEGMIKLPNFILNSIKDGRTSLGKHPSFPPEDEKRFEEKILLKRFMELGKSLSKINDLEQHDKQTLTNKLSEYVRKAIIIETPLRKELEKLCYDFVCGQFDLTPGELDITCELKDRIEPEKLPNVEPMLLDDTEFDDITSIDNLGKEIYKRRLINSLIQGASIRLSSEFNKIVSDLYELNPSLIELYHNILIVNEYLSFIKEVKPDNKNLGGFVSVDLSNPEPKISSEAVIFPVLVFETVKGIMELVASHGLPKNRREAEYVIGKADFSLAENWDKRFGVGLYDLFSKNIQNKKLQTEVFAEFVELEPERFFIKTKEVFANTRKGKEFITNLEKYITRGRGFDDIDKAIGVNNSDFNTFDVNTGGNDTDFYFEREDFNLGMDAGGYFHVDELGGLITDSVTTSSAGDYTYDVPLFGDEETLNHKDMIKNSQMKWNVREEDEKLIDEMAYPTSFNMEEFKNIGSFAGRVAYCRKHLTRIAEGSSRMVFKIDDEKVLKLAKNRKGLGQNKAEADMGYNEGYFTCIAHVFDYDDNYMFVEMELANKCSKQDFLRITGYDFETFVKYLQAESNGDLRKEFSQEFIDEAYDNSSIMTEVSEFVRTYELPLGDIYPLRHYGIVKRKGEEYIVLIDYGLTSDVYEKYY